MPKKKSGRLSKQLNVRVSEAIYDRVDAVAFKLGIDPSDLVRMILAERLPEYETRTASLPGPQSETRAQT